MFCRILSSAIFGIGCEPVYIELDISSGMPTFIMVGSVSARVKESQDRVRTALRSLDIFLPPKRITLNLSPGEIKKDGTRFDLPIAAALLIALEKIPERALEGCMLTGELHLNGETEGVPGILPSILTAVRLGIKTCIVPYKNAAEASTVQGVNIVALNHLSELIEFGNAEDKSSFFYNNDTSGVSPPSSLNFSDILGQTAVKRAALISAAGFHNILMCGPPGSGKSMAAKRLPSILPDLTSEEQLEVSQIYSVSGLLNSEYPVVTQRPFRSPHYSLSAQALCGGGRIPAPGEITLAHRGILFIDELPEMSRRTIEQLRIPMEDRYIRISRTEGSFCFPANFLLAAAMNPCPCGHYPDLNKCTCSPAEIQSYISKLSRPIMDRIDIRVNVPAPSYTDLTSESRDEMSSEKMKAIVCKAFEIQQERYASSDINFNSELSPAGIKKFCTVTSEGNRLLKSAFIKMEMSARAYHRVLKLSRTIADIEGSELIREAHISEAFAFRNQNIDRK